MGPVTDKANGTLLNTSVVNSSVRQIPNENSKSTIEVHQSSSESLSFDTKKFSQHILLKSHEPPNELKESNLDTSYILYQTEVKTKTPETLTNIQNTSLQNKHTLRVGIAKKIANMSANSVPVINSSAGKSREEIMTEREAKKLAKQMKKAKALSTHSEAALITAPVARTPSAHVISQEQDTAAVDNSREQIKAEREVKKKSKQAQKDTKATSITDITAKLNDTKITEDLYGNTLQEEKVTTLHYIFSNSICLYIFDILRTNLL